MKLHTIAVVALVALLATAGAAVAAPGNAPAVPDAADSGHGASDDARDGEAAENASAADGDVSAAHAQGPGEDLPEPVPDHVTQIHDLIRQFLGGSLDGSLGEAISGVVPSDDAASETPADASG